MPTRDAVSVFQRVLANSFGDLPGTLQRVHDARPAKRLFGHCDVERGHNWMVKWLAPIASLPTTAVDTPLSVAIDADAQSETWTRDFNGHRMQSRLWASGELLAERLGPITLYFTLRAAGGCLEWRVAGARYFGVPLPLRWFAGAAATEQIKDEQIKDGRYTFDVRATLPLVGLLVHYRGWLAEHE